MAEENSSTEEKTSSSKKSKGKRTRRSTTKKSTKKATNRPDRGQGDAKKRLDKRAKAGNLKGLDANDPLLGWTAQQGPPRSPRKKS